MNKTLTVILTTLLTALGLVMIGLLAQPFTRVVSVASTATVLPPSPTALPLVTAPDGTFIGEVVLPPRPLHDAEMMSSTGAPMRLNDLNGEWRLLFFGYLRCPDFCPLTLSEYRQVKRLLGEQGDAVRFVYVSVDADRDTPQAMAEYLDNFDPTFLGLAADDATLAAIQPDYGFYYRRRVDTGSRAAYTVDHSTRSYLIDPDGRLRATFTYNLSAEDVASAIAWWMAHPEGV